MDPKHKAAEQVISTVKTLRVMCQLCLSPQRVLSVACLVPFVAWLWRGTFGVQGPLAESEVQAVNRGDLRIVHAHPCLIPHTTFVVRTDFMTYAPRYRRNGYLMGAGTITDNLVEKQVRGRSHRRRNMLISHSFG